MPTTYNIKLVSQSSYKFVTTISGYRNPIKTNVTSSDRPVRSNSVTLTS